MKKAILSMTAVVIMALAFVSCGNNGGKQEPANQEPANQEQVNQEKADQGIVGNWYYDDNTFYTFNEDGTGSYTFAGTPFGNFTYTKGESQLSLTYEGSTDPMVFNYKLDGKTLTILSGESNLGSDTDYTRK